MTKVKIDPGICGFIAEVTADTNDDDEIIVKVTSGCKAVQAMMDALGDTFDGYQTCLVKPGKNAFYEFAGENFPVHAGCATISGITKCIEAEAGLALKRNVSITFEE